MPEKNIVATGEQPQPQGDGLHQRKDVCELVKQDLEDRIQLGAERYKERLQTFNGRNAMWDAYQEALDLIVYIRQHLEEAMEYRKWEDWARSWYGDYDDAPEWRQADGFGEVTFEEIKWRAEEERRVKTEAQGQVLKCQREHA